LRIEVWPIAKPSRQAAFAHERRFDALEVFLIQTPVTKGNADG